MSGPDFISWPLQLHKLLASPLAASCHLQSVLPHQVKVFAVLGAN